jgi:hypothetical protein
MAALFSAKWMEQYAKAWKGDAQIVNGLSAIQFDSNIGYGFIGDPQPAGVLIVKGGKSFRQVPTSSSH